MASGLGDLQLDIDPALAELAEPAPLQGFVRADIPGPGGEGGTAPQDPQNGDGIIEVPMQPNPAVGGGSKGKVAERVTKIACQEIHYVDLICGGERLNFYFPSYQVPKGSVVVQGEEQCPGTTSSNLSVPSSIGPGVPGSSGCGSVYSGPGGTKCMPACDEDVDPDAFDDSDIPTGPLEDPIELPGSASSGGGDATPNNGPGGAAPLLDEIPPLGAGTSNNSGAGGTIFGGIFSGGGSFSGGPGIMDFPANNGDYKREFEIQISDGQGANAQLDPGEFVRVIQNADGTMIVGKISRQGGKTFFVEIQRIQPARSGQNLLFANAQNQVLQAQITQLQAQISKITEKPLSGNDLKLEAPVNYPVPSPTLPAYADVVYDDEIPEPPRNDPRPRPKKKNRNEKLDPVEDPPTKKPGSAPGTNGNTTQLVIVQDDSSQSFVRIT